MRQLCLAILLLICATVGAQEIQVSEDIVLRNDIAYEIIGKFGDHTLLFRNQSTYFEVMAFNQQLRTMWTKEIALDRRNPRLIGLTAGEDDFSVFYHFRQQGMTLLKAHKYNPGCNLVDSITIRNLGFLFNTPRFSVVFSEDRSKALLYYYEQASILRAFAFDVAQMALLWETSIVIEDPYSASGFTSMLVDNSGKMYFVKDRNNFRARTDLHYYEIITYDGGPQVYVQRIDLQGRFTFDVRFDIDNLNHQFVAAGFFGTDNNLQADGYFYLNLPVRTDSLHKLSFIPFDANFLNTLLGKEYKPGRGLLDIHMRDIVLRRDGGLLLVGERYRQIERRGPSARMMNEASFRILIDYYYEEIIAAAINPDGSLHWQSILHKKQYSQDDDAIYSSFFLMKTAGKLRLIYNDEIRSENTVSEYLINAKGDWERISLFSTEQLDLRLRFRDATQVSASQVIIPSERRSRLRLIKIAY